ncbi:cupin domain-containing protein [Dyadobacter sp. CY356]|uniref:cupin domain-containing protein n=1 Tax=Dyadobacter sp. CY356 TaxID=2906442 RepID=UPI001F1D2BE9|nr:cupin domain-containing protein [Dyadobacter sp. CY356]MCF0055698.1 cupin [Dyadobacter sp. CY356]
MKIETYLFKDDGLIPNSKYPLIIYKNAFSKRGKEAGSWLEKHFESNNWTNSWRNGVFSYHHYHSISHEVLGIYEGSATLFLGGEKGQKLLVSAGDIIVIPAGVGHKNLGSSNDFKVIGAYPNGMDYDILRGKPEERKQADQNIENVPFPDSDPFLGKSEGLRTLWSKIR